MLRHGIYFNSIRIPWNRWYSHFTDEKMKLREVMFLAQGIMSFLLYSFAFIYHCAISYNYLLESFRWKDALSLVLLFDLKQHQENIRCIDSQEWKTLVYSEGNCVICFSQQWEKDGWETLLTQNRNPLGGTENNNWHKIETVGLVKRIPSVNLGIEILVRA